MTRIYSDQLLSAGRRYYFALDSAAGVVTPGVATITLFGRQPAISDQSIAFRTPATATLTLIGNSLSSPSLLIPATAGLTLAGTVSGLETIRIVIPAVPQPVETPENSYAPTLITIMTVSPDKATLTLQSLELNVSQGGNIAFVSPARATLTIGGLSANFAFSPDQAALQIIGYAPTLNANLVGSVTPDPAVLACIGLEPTIEIPFEWVDDERVPPTSWIDDPRA